MRDLLLLILVLCLNVASLCAHAGDESLAGVGAEEVKELLRRTEKKRRPQATPERLAADQKQRNDARKKDKKGAPKPEESLSKPATLLFETGGMSLDFGKQKLGVDRDLNIRMRNVGSLPATQITPILLRGAFNYKGGSFPGRGGNCGRTIEAGTECLLVIEYQSRVPGPHNVDLSVSYFSEADELRSSVRLMASSALPGKLDVVKKESLDFGEVVLLSTKVQAIVLKNVGESMVGNLHPATAEIPTPFAYTGAHYPGAKGACKANLEPGEECTLEIRVTPNRLGNAMESFALNFVDGLEKQKFLVPLRAQAIPPAKLVASWPEGELGSLIQGQKIQKFLELKNVGGAPAAIQTMPTLAAPYSFPGGKYPGTGGNCGSILEKGATCKLSLAFEARTVGDAVATLQWTYQDGHQLQTLQTAVRAHVLKPADLVLTLAEKNLGEVTVGNAFQGLLYVQNAGEVEAQQMEVAGLTAPFALGSGEKSCGTQLKPSEKCTVYLKGKIEKAGPYKSGLVLHFFDGAAKQKRETKFEITGLEPALLGMTATPPATTLILGETYQATLEIRNTGASLADKIELRSSNPALAALPFKPETCSQIAPRASCTFQVRAKIETPQLYQTEFSVGYFDGSRHQTAKQAVSVNVLSPARITGLGESADLGKVLIGKSARKDWTLVNEGGTEARNWKLRAEDPQIKIQDECAKITAWKSGARCKLTVEWIPTAKQLLKQTLQYEFHDGAKLQKGSLILTGEALNPAQLVMSAQTLDFGNKTVGNMDEKNLTGQNTGDVPATIKKVQLIGKTDFALTEVEKACALGELAAQQSCKLSVGLHALTPGEQNATVQISYFDGLSDRVITVKLVAQVRSQALLAWESPAMDFGEMPRGKNTRKLVRVSNTGDTAADWETPKKWAEPFEYVGGTFPGTGGSCGPKIAPKSSCVLALQAKANQTGDFQDRFEFPYRDGNSQKTAPLELKARVLEPAQLVVVEGADFGLMRLGQVQEKTLKIKNAGAWTSTEMKPVGPGLKRPLAIKGERYPGTGGTCGSELKAGASCTIVLHFKPDIPSTVDGKLMLTYSDGVVAKLVEIPVKGEATIPAKIHLTQASPVRVEPVVSGKKQFFTIPLLNEGMRKATAIKGIVKGKHIQFTSGVFPGTGSKCAELGAGDRCELKMEFDSQSAGSDTAQVEIEYFDAFEQKTLKFAIEAKAITPAKLELSQGVSTEGAPVIVGGKGVFSLKIRNTGEAPARLDETGFMAKNFDWSGGDFPGEKGNCAEKIPGGKECTVEIQYTPNTSGPVQTVVKVPYEDGLASQAFEFVVSGTGLSPAKLDLSHKKIEFPPTLVGQSANFELEVVNSGEYGAVVRDVSGTTKAFRFAGGKFPGEGGTCGKNIPSGGVCKLRFEFAPPSSDDWDTDFELRFFDGKKDVEIEFKAVGQSKDPARLVWTEKSVEFERRSVGGPASEVRIGVKNVGESIATDLGKNRGLDGVFRFAGGSYPGKGGNCGESLEPGASCEMVVEMGTEKAGVHQQTIKLAYRDGAKPALLQTEFEGRVDTLALLLASPPEVSFEPQEVGSEKSRIVRIHNSGETVATEMRLDLSGNGFAFTGGKAPGERGNCDSTLRPGTSCQVELSYVPRQAREDSGSLKLLYRDGAKERPLSIGLSGRGLETRALSSDPQ